MSQLLKGSTIKILVLAAVMFTYGFSSGYFKIFPFQIIDNIHTAVIKIINPAKKSQNSKKEQSVKIQKNKNYRTHYYLGRLSTFKQSTISADYIIIGDSIVDSAEWHELLVGVSIVNRGIAGDTTFGVLRRINNSLSKKPKKLFLMVGINDIEWGYDIEQSIENYKKIIAIIKQSKIQATIFSVIYPGKSQQEIYLKKFKGDLQKRVQLFNQLLEKECVKEGINYVDVNSTFIKDGFLNDEFSYDGLHLNGVAYSKFAEILKNNL
ncbi:MAG: hypothetical protein HQL69_08380 [Magnetococcales bacterium]|nr:hypothetical protein [Magnetococcales bacterium]